MTTPTNISSARRRKKQMAPVQPVGRPTKATQSTTDKLVEALKLGATHKLAAQYARIGETTFYKWLRDPSPEFDEIRQVIADAESEGAMHSLATISALKESGDPAIMFKAATWLLERRYPEQYGRQVVTTEHSGEQVVRVVFDNAWRGEAQLPDVTPEHYIEASVESDAASESPSVKLTFEGD